MSNPQMGYGMETWDYVVVILVIVLSSVIGLYSAFRVKHKTAQHFLVASRDIGIFPLVISSIATGLTATTILGQPAESYSNGIQVVFFSLAMILGAVFNTYVVLPVFFRLNVSTANQYIEYRFNRFLRVIPAFLYLLQSILVMSSLSHLTALVCSNALGITYWTSITLICGTCAIYTSVGGFTAVIWTDVLQAVVVVISVGFLLIKGTMDAGGVAHVWNTSYEGNRTVMIRFSAANETNYSIFSMMIGGFIASIQMLTTNQALLQRQMANKNLRAAKITALFGNITVPLLFVSMSWVGLVIFTYYNNCDPLLNGEIRSRDQLVAVFVKDIFKNIDGLIGLFIAGVLAATLSTLSSFVNSLTTVIIVDFVKPMFPDVRDGLITIYSKIIGILYSCAVVAATLLVSKFGSVKQLTFMIAGSSGGPSAGVFLLGFIFPWSTARGAVSGYVCALVLCNWAAIGRFLSTMPHYSLPVRTDGCGVRAFNYINQSLISSASNFTTETNQTAYFEETLIAGTFKNISLVAGRGRNDDDIFGLYRVPPLWYHAMAVGVVLIVGTVVSFATGIQDPETLDPHLISPLTWCVLKRLPVTCRRWLGFKSERFHGDMKLATICKGTTMFNHKEMEVLNPQVENVNFENN